MITNIFLFPNGALACTNEDGEQVPEEQENMLINKLQDQLERGVISPLTVVHLANGVNPTVKELLGY